MARIAKEAEQAVKRREILAAAQRLVLTKGFDQMTIQDVLDALGISKGAFYHYFASKSELLEGLIELMLAEGMQLLTPIVQDPGLSAPEKLLRFFDASARWKAARKDYVLSFLRVWYADENALVRQKMQAATIQRSAPLLAAIVRQGNQEGVFDMPLPDQAGEIVLSLLANFGDAFLSLMYASEQNQDALRRAVQAVAAYNLAMERLLGARPGSLQLIGEETLREWVGTLANSE
ncbi:MAG: TetR/AcrR family transcriptional regulator [Anaerolineales bacterium]|nr:TetR/AcrR family transcriptional regulator [Anaerolineales bacterium]